MAIIVMMKFAGVSETQYDGVLKDMNLGGRVPKEIGGRFHVAGFSDGNLQVVDVWASQVEFDKFAAEKIMPLAAKNGITSPPEVQIIPVHNMLT